MQVNFSLVEKINGTGIAVLMYLVSGTNSATKHPWSTLDWSACHVVGSFWRSYYFIFKELECQGDMKECGSARKDMYFINHFNNNKNIIILAIAITRRGFREQDIALKNKTFSSGKNASKVPECQNIFPSSFLPFPSPFPNDIINSSGLVVIFLLCHG